MNVAILCGFPFHKNRYGVAEHIFQVSRQICSTGSEHTCHIISMHNRTEHWQESPRLWVHTIQRKPLYFLLPFLAVRAIRGVLDEINPDILHLHGTAPPYVWTASQMAGSMPVLLTIHGDMEIEAIYKKPFARLWTLTFLHSLLKHALLRIKTVITCSEFAREKLERSASQRIFVIPNGVDLENFFPMKANSQSDRAYILYMGGLRTIKGVDVLIRAFAQIQQRFTDVDLLIAGSGPEEKTLKRLANELSPGSRVRFLGFVSGKSKLSLLQQARLIVVPSRHESFPIGLLEALACGTPLVAARVGGIPEIIRHDENGWLFEPENVGDLAEQISAALLNPDKRALYRRNGLSTAANYSWEKIAQQTLQVYRDCAGHFIESKA